MNKNIIRHRTLKILCDKHDELVYKSGKYDTTPTPIDATLGDIPVDVFLNVFKISDKEFRMANIAVSAAEEIKYRRKIEDPTVEVISLEGKGLVAYADKKYIKILRDGIIDIVTKIILPLTAITISIISLCISLKK